MSNQIFLVTSGEYSSYSVMAAFSTQEKADEYAAYLTKKGDDSAQVEVFEIDSLPVPATRPHWECVLRTSDGSLYWESDKHVESAEPLEVSHAALDYSYGYSFKSAEHARKLAAEARQSWLRETHGGAMNPEETLYASEDEATGMLHIKYKPRRTARMTATGLVWEDAPSAFTTAVPFEGK